MIIEIKEITKVYDRRKVVDIPYASINEGEILGLVGNNGAGKTTLFRLILDLIRPTTGKIRSRGENVAKSDHWKSYTGSYLDEGFLIENLTPEEYFEFIGGLNGLSKQDVHLRLNGFEDLFNGEILKKGKYIRDLSKGNKNKTGIAAAMMINPQILVLDEPFASLDPTTQIRLKKIIRENKSRDVTMLISSHDLTHVTEVCDRIIVLEKGVVINDFETNENSLRELEQYFSDRRE